MKVKKDIELTQNLTIRKRQEKSFTQKKINDNNLNTENSNLSS